MSRSVGAAAVFLLACLAVPVARADVPLAPDVNLRSLFYDFVLMAESSASGFTALGDSPSVNRSGTVAFQAQNALGQGVYASDGLGITDLTPGFDGPSRAFGRAVMLSDAGTAIESDRASGSPPPTFIRLWPGNGSGAFTTLGRGGAGQPFDSVLSHPALSANGAAWAFTALAPGSVVRQLATPLGVTDLLGNGGAGYRPVVANDGTVVLRDSNIALLQVQVFRGGSPSALDVVAGTSAGFSAIGNQPGISDSGRIVGFSGNRGNGQGVFIGFEETPGVWTLARVVGEGAGAQGNRPDLGFDTADQPVFFSSVNLDARVAVMHQERGAPGLEGDTVVVAFMGTPNGASTYPRFGHFPGLFFRAAPGLWTMRLDILRDSAGLLQLRRQYAVPVAQVGDTISGVGISGFVVAGLAVHDPLAEATTDDLGQPLTRAAGSHRMAFWAVDAAGKQVILRGTHVNGCLIAVRHFSQCDARWSGRDYVGTGNTFCEKACALTAQTMAANTGGATYGVAASATPLAVHDFIRPRAGFSGASVHWLRSIQALRQPGGPLAVPANSLRFQLTRRSVLPTSSDATVNAALNYIDDNLCDAAEPAPVVLGADRSLVDGVLVAGHYILASGRVNDRRFIADPGYANGILFSQGTADNPISTQYQRNFETRGVVKDPPNLGGMSISATGAARLLVTDAAGRRSGLLTGVTEPVQDIPGGVFVTDGLRNLSTASGVQNLSSSYYAAEPGTQSYVVQVVGAGGSFSLTSDVILADGTLTTPVTVTDTAALGEVKAYTVRPLAGGVSLVVGSTLVGDLDGDLDVDSDDINYLLFDRGRTVAASRCGARCDLTADGKIDTLDARKLATLCTRPGCGTK